MLNRNTVHRAYEQLISDGILHLPDGRRTICIAPHALTRVIPPFPSIGIILPRQFSVFAGGDTPTPLKYLSGIFDRAAELGYAPMPLLLPPPETPDAEVREWLKNMLSRLTTMIHLGDRGFTPDRPLELTLTENFLPQIFISGYSHDVRIASVVCDLEGAFTALTGYLKENGHHRIGVIGECFEPNPYFNYTYRSRTARSIDALRRNGMELRDEWILRIPQLSSPLEPLRDMLQACGKELPGVFFCSNDATAERTFTALRELGRKVPGEFSLVGADDTGIAEKMPVPLTTLKVPMYAIGRASVDLALERFYNGPAEETRLRKIPSTLVLRSSVKPQGEHSAFPERLP